MARLLALEWDASEARVVVGNTRGRDLFVEQAFSIPLAGPDDAGREPDVGRRIAEALTERHLGRSDTLVAVGRANIELRLLSMPQAPQEELPDLVRFQAVRQFATLGEEWPLDFVTVDSGSEDQTQSVLAAAISPDLVAQIMKVCETAQLVPHRLILRPFAAASLLRKASDVRDCRLVVDLLAAEVDLTVVAAGQVAFIRTIRLPTDAQGELQVAGLVGEIRRTIGAAQNQLGGGQRVEQITLCGDPSGNAVLRQTLTQELALPVSDFDPFAGLTLGERLATGLPWHRGRFASLLGMLADEAAGSDHGIDFLHPRKKPVPPSNRRRNLLLAGSAAAIVVAVAVAMVGWLWNLDGQISTLSTQRSKLEAEVKKSEKLRKHSDEIEKFVDGDVVWLDEVAWISARLPPPEKALVTSLSTRGGTLHVDLLGEDSGTVAATERALRDAEHEVTGTGSRTETKEKGYSQLFKVQVRVKPPAVDSAAAAKVDAEKSPAPASTPPASAPPASTTLEPATQRSTPEAPPADTQQAPAVAPSESVDTSQKGAVQ